MLVLVTIAVALGFDFINGFHDAANSIATVVSTRVLKPQTAVLWAAFFNFVAVFVFATAVAKTIGRSGMIKADVVTSDVILGGLVGAIVWNLLTWWLGLPTSSSHALIGGFAGAAVAQGRLRRASSPGEGLGKTLVVHRPLAAARLRARLSSDARGLLDVPRRRRRHGRPRFRRAQLFSAARYSLGHGGNDAQKTMGIIAACSSPRAVFRSAARLPLHASAEHEDDPVLDRPLGQRGDRPRHADRRLAHRADDGHEASPSSSPVGGFCAETGAAATITLGLADGRPGVDDAHDHRRRSSASARRSASRRCAGAWRAGSSTRGS